MCLPFSNQMKCYKGLRSKTLLCSLLFYLPLSSRVPLFGFRYMRGLHNQIKVLEDRTAPKEEEIDGTSHVHDSIISMGDNSMLMLGNGPMPGYGMPLPPQSMGGMDASVAGLSGVNGTAQNLVFFTFFASLLKKCALIYRWSDARDRHGWADADEPHWIRWSLLKQNTGRVMKSRKVTLTRS